MAYVGRADSNPLPPRRTRSLEGLPQGQAATPGSLLALSTDYAPSGMEPQAGLWDGRDAGNQAEGKNQPRGGTAPAPRRPVNFLLQPPHASPGFTPHPNNSAIISGTYSTFPGHHQAHQLGKAGSPVDRVPSLTSWGGVVADPAKGGLSLRMAAGVPPLSPATQPGVRARAVVSLQGGDGDILVSGYVRSHRRSTGVPGVAQQGAALVSSQAGMMGGDVGWAAGRGSSPVHEAAGMEGPMGLSRTSSAPPLGASFQGQMGDFRDMYRSNASEASTPDASPSRCAIVPVMSSSPSPERDRRSSAHGLPRTKLSRTSSCPPLVDLLEDSELASSESDEDESLQDGDGGSSEECGKESSGPAEHKKRKRLRPHTLPLLSGGGMQLGPSMASTGGESPGGSSGQRSPSRQDDLMDDTKLAAHTEDGEGSGESPNAEVDASPSVGAKGSKGGKSSSSLKSRGEKKKDKERKAAEAPADYIHVRARRGQATDSHSLAERVRREKISERMKVLQDLVPTCSRVTGKALMLDEIINYVKSLQLQVELLSSKLAAIGHGEEDGDESHNHNQHVGPGALHANPNGRSSPEPQATATRDLQESNADLKLLGGGMQGMGAHNQQLLQQLGLQDSALLQEMLCGSVSSMEGLNLDQYPTNKANLQGSGQWEGDLTSIVQMSLSGRNVADGVEANNNLSVKRELSNP